MKKICKIFASTLLVIVFTTGILYGLLFLAFQLGWTKENGQIDQNNWAYNTAQTVELTKAQSSPTNEDIAKNELSLKNLCKLKIIKTKYPENGNLIQAAYDKTRSGELLNRMIFVFNLKSADYEFQKELTTCNSTLTQISQIISAEKTYQNNQNVYIWTQTEEWPIIIEAITKDKDIINKAANAADIDSRLLVAPVIVEQLRLYFTQREYFKQFFKPLKILGVTNQMSMGVMSLKEKTAKQIENQLKDVSSPYYLGKEYENLLDFKTNNPANERTIRLTDQHNQYYAYLYGALYIKQVQTQWKKAGFPINDRPEIISTLYNLGFEKSKPNAEPKIGGSTLKIGGVDYTFGGLASEFYYSGEMQDIFPYKSSI
jgi:hypothetical protein